MKLVKTRTLILLKFILLIQLTLYQRNLATINQIMLELGCCRSTAYNYLRALRQIFPETFPPENTDVQQNINSY